MQRDNAGRGTPHGGVWLDVTHLPARGIEERLPVMLEQFLNYGVDIRTEPMEVAPTAHHIMGGFALICIASQPPRLPAVKLQEECMVQIVLVEMPLQKHRSLE